MKILILLTMVFGSLNIWAAGRNYAIQLEAEMTETEVENTPGGTGTTDTVEVSIAAKRNMGRFEYGGFLNYGTTDVSGGADDKLYQIGLLGDINFIPNTSAQMVPYLGGRVSYATGEESSVDKSGFGYGADLGLKFFFAGGLAVNVAYGMTILDLTIDTTPESDRKITTSGLKVGLSYYF